MFGDTTSGVVNVNVSAPITVDSISFTNMGAAYTLSGSLISLSMGSATKASVTQSGTTSNTLAAPLAAVGPATATTFDVGVATSLTASGVISGGGDLDKIDSGTLVLAAGDTYTGATVVNGGTLQLVPVTPAASIGVHFVGSNHGGTAVANATNGSGAFSMNDWMNLTAFSFAIQPLTDNTGAGTGASFSMVAPGTWNSWEAAISFSTATIT